MEEAIALLRQLSKERFFGALTIKFESGKIVILKKEETIKPQPCRDHRGETYADINS
jgi:hypothetical protein